MLNTISNMITSSNYQQTTIASLLTRNIPRDLIMGVEDALITGAKRGFSAGSDMNEGHRPHAVGQMRHFHMNETFRDALEVAGGNPSGLKGNRIVTGTSGIFTLGRFNVTNGVWNNGRRSRGRREMALANIAIEPLVTPDLFEKYKPASKATVFFVGVFESANGGNASQPISIDVVVPDHQLQNWLFKASIRSVLALYEPEIDNQQVDLAIPLLKSNIGSGNHQVSGT